MSALLGQPWQQSTIEAALTALREDVNVAPTAPGGRGEYRNSLAASFLYKFYVHVSVGTFEGVRVTVFALRACEWRGEYRNSLAASFLYKFYVHVSVVGLLRV
jgi:xanthine dehydrogenase iron-sulfur cluster and FAD-binding subunit A